MGCLLELIFGMAFEIVGEAIYTLYVRLITSFVPEHQFNPKLRKKIKKGISVFTGVLFICALWGLFTLLEWRDSSVSTTVGVCMFFIPLGITGVFILIGMIDRIIRSKRKRR